MDMLQQLRDDSARFAEVLRLVAPTTPVPTCPDWTAADLAWHLTDVQWFWRTVVGGRLLDPPQDEDRPARPVRHGDVLDLFEEQTRALITALERTPDVTRVWTWADDDTVSWVRRRQTHEALVHRLDAEATAGRPSTVSAEIASDGIDELLGVYVTGVPDWGTFVSGHQHVAVEISDIGRTWGLELGRMTGTSPRSGRTHDLPAAMTAPAALATTTIRGEAAPLHAWLWGRGDRAPLSIEGDVAVADTLRAVIADSTG